MFSSARTQTTRVNPRLETVWVCTLLAAAALAGSSSIPHIGSLAAIFWLRSYVRSYQLVCPWSAQVEPWTLLSLAGFPSRRERWPQLRRAHLAEPPAGSELARQSAIPFRPREAQRCLRHAQHRRVRALRNRLM